MSKKNFRTGFESLLGEGSENTVKENHSKDEKDKAIEIRATIIVEADLFHEIKAISYWERKKIKDVVNESFKEYVEKYKKENNGLKGIPE